MCLPRLYYALHALRQQLQQQPRDVPAANAGGETTAPADIRPGRRLIAVMLLAAAGLDLTRCGLVLVTARHAGAAAGSSRPASPQPH